MDEPTLMQLTEGLAVDGAASEQDLADVERALGWPFPPDYRAFVKARDGIEGFLGEAYVALWPVAEVPALNEAFETSVFAPGLILFGTDGGGEGYGFDPRSDILRVVMVPLVGMDWTRAIHLADSFTRFLQSLADGGLGSPPNPRTQGLSVFEIQPVVAGGSPTDPQNKTLVSVEKLASLAVWWNRQLRRQ